MDAARPFVDCSACGNPLASRLETSHADLAALPSHELRECCLLCGLTRQYTIDDYYVPNAGNGAQRP